MGLRYEGHGRKRKIAVASRCISTALLLSTKMEAPVRKRTEISRIRADRGGVRKISRRRNDPFYALSIYGSIPEGAKGFEKIDKAEALLRRVYAVAPNHPGVLRYLIHVNDDPVHAQQGFAAARAYAGSAAAVPHAQHLPSHIFTRLGLWAESATTNENAWHTSEADVKRAGESGAYRDFHSLNYLQYAYLELGRFKDAKWATDIIAKQYADTPNKTTAPDTPLLEARHVPANNLRAT